MQSQQEPVKISNLGCKNRSRSCIISLVAAERAGDCIFAQTIGRRIIARLRGAQKTRRREKFRIW